MSAKSSYMENKVLALVLTNTAFSPPANVYIALFNGNPTTSGAEATGGSYARQTAAFSTPSGGSCQNSGTVTFTNMPAMTVSYVAIYDASSGGNLLYYTPAATPKNTNSGDTISIAIGGIVVTES